MAYHLFQIKQKITKRKKILWNWWRKFVTHTKLSHGDALVHCEALLFYLEQEDKNTPDKKWCCQILVVKLVEE